MTEYFVNFMKVTMILFDIRGIFDSVMVFARNIVQYSVTIYLSTVTYFLNIFHDCFIVLYVFKKHNYDFSFLYFMKLWVLYTNQHSLFRVEYDGVIEYILCCISQNSWKFIQWKFCSAVLAWKCNKETGRITY